MLWYHKSYFLHVHYSGCLQLQMCLFCDFTQTFVSNVVFSLSVLEMKDKMAVPLFALLAVCVDVCAVMFIGAIQLSPSFINNTFILLWAGGLLRTCLLLFISFTYPGSPVWMRGFEGVQTAVIHGLLYPVYISFLCACDRSTVELVWGWHTCQGVRCVLTRLNGVQTPGRVL